MVINILLLIVGFVLLIKGADFFVDGASSLAENFKVPKIIIALTIVAFGTSAPELAVSIQAILSSNSDMVLGNVVGSNILNVLLILGLASLFGKLRVKANTVKKEIPITFLMSLLLFAVAFDNIFDFKIVNTISRNDGLTILLFFAIFLYYLFTTIRHNKEELNGDSKPKYNIILSIVFLALGLAGIIFGSNFVVNNASAIAKILGVSDKMVALTVVALGTSLPELVTSVQAVRKGENDIAVGNVIGSNIFNIGMVIGLPAFLVGEVSATSFNYIDMLTMIASVMILFIFTFKDKQLTKFNGIIMLLMFVVYYTFVILGGI